MQAHASSVRSTTRKLRFVENHASVKERMSHSGLKEIKRDFILRKLVETLIFI